MKWESHTVGEKRIHIELQALWVSDISVKIISASQGNVLVARRQNSAEVNITGGELVGEPKNCKGISVSMSFTYFVNNDCSFTGRRYSKTNSYNIYKQSDSIKNEVLERRNYILCEAKIEYSWNGESLHQPLTSVDSWKY